MRVLFTSLFFCLVAILTLASHPPTELISQVFGGGTPVGEDRQIVDSKTAPTGIIPVSGSPEPPTRAIPDPIAVPTSAATEAPGTTPDPLVSEIQKLETEIAIAAAPEAIEPPDGDEATTAENALAEAIAPAGKLTGETPTALSENPDTPENRGFIRTLNLYAIYFGAGKTDLPADSRSSIAKAASKIADLPDGVTAIVGGHTDAHSEAEDSWEVGTLRATAVLDALIAAGAPADRLQIAHYPSDAKRPKASDAWRDRRVEFHLLPPR